MQHSLPSLPNWTLVILAAGKGSRLGKPVPKPLVEVGGKPLMQPIVETGLAMGFHRVVVVISEHTAQIKDHFSHLPLVYVTAEPKGTGYAVAKALEHVETPYFIVSGADDSYFYTKEMLTGLVQFHEKENIPLTMGYCVTHSTHAAEVPEHRGGRITRIRQDQEAFQTPPPKDIPAGLYAGKTEWVKEALTQVGEDARYKGEVPLPGIVHVGLAQGDEIGAFKVPEEQWHGVNTPEELAKAEEKAQRLAGN
ncbi:MAG TPA: NTP transferase domain-containing protein [Verrucomicrobiae bacterium]|nr:NTP transferase domain-containing protein [Verrucomicrobiae bacterium]